MSYLLPIFAFAIMALSIAIHLIGHTPPSWLSVSMWIIASTCGGAAFGMTWARKTLAE